MCNCHETVEPWESPVKWVFEKLEYASEQFDFWLSDVVWKLKNEFRYLLLPKEHIATEILDQILCIKWELEWLEDKDTDWADHLASYERGKINTAIAWFNGKKPWWIPAKKYLEV